MAATLTVEGLRVGYYRSFKSYQIPFQPEQKVSFAGTAGLRSFYRCYRNRDGRILEFTKILLNCVDRREIDFTCHDLPGSTVFFRVDRKRGKSAPGKQIAFVETEDMTEFFEGEVSESGDHCRLTLFRKEQAFKDVYEYWPNGNLRKRMLTRMDKSNSVWPCDEEGNILEAEEREERSLPREEEGGDLVFSGASETDWFGDSTTEHSDASGEKTGESRETTGIFGDEKNEHPDMTDESSPKEKGDSDDSDEKSDNDSETGKSGA